MVIVEYTLLQVKSEAKNIVTTTLQRLNAPYKFPHTLKVYSMHVQGLLWVNKCNRNFYRQTKS